MLEATSSMIALIRASCLLQDLLGHEAISAKDKIPLIVAAIRVSTYESPQVCPVPPWRGLLSEGDILEKYPGR